VPHLKRRSTAQLSDVIHTCMLLVRQMVSGCWVAPRSPQLQRQQHANLAASAQAHPSQLRVTYTDPRRGVKHINRCCS
jgi:hypothetical protein